MPDINLSTYDGRQDAEYILEEIMMRQRWSIQVRDEIADALVKLAHGETLTTNKRGKKK